MPFSAYICARAHGNRKSRITKLFDMANLIVGVTLERMNIKGFWFVGLEKEKRKKHAITLRA